MANKNNFFFLLKCCVGGDVPKIQVLKHLYEELEICFKSLQAYLNARRKVLQNLS